MITVGVRELKNNLSRYLRSVKQGRLVEITERGESIAMLVPPNQRSALEVAAVLIRKGIGSWKGGRPKGASGRVTVKGKSVSQMVIEERR
jgi:prevent-host-death family protein